MPHPITGIMKKNHEMESKIQSIKQQTMNPLTNKYQDGVFVKNGIWVELQKNDDPNHDCVFIHTEKKVIGPFYRIQFDGVDTVTFGEMIIRTIRNLDASMTYDDQCMMIKYACIRYNHQTDGYYVMCDEKEGEKDEREMKKIEEIISKCQEEISKYEEEIRTHRCENTDETQKNVILKLREIEKLNLEIRRQEFMVMYKHYYFEEDGTVVL